MDNSRRKTLANCTAEEFLAQAYKTRDAFHTLYNAAHVDTIRDKYAAEREKAKTQEERERSDGQFSAELTETVLRYHQTELLAVVAACGFMTPQEAGQLEPAEFFGILRECAADSAVMTFFIRLEQWAPSSTAGILPMLLLIWSAALGAGTSATASQDDTTATDGGNYATNTSESASVAS